MRTNPIQAGHLDGAPQGRAGGETNRRDGMPRPRVHDAGRRAAKARFTLLCGPLLSLLAVLSFGVPATLGQSPGCGESPALDCRTSAKSKLIVQRKGPGNDKLIWKWGKGDATTQADFGVPTGTATYSLCVYSGSHSDLVVAVDAPADPTTWSAIGTKGYKYKSSGAGIQKIILKGGEQGKAKILVKGKGFGFPETLLPSQLPVRVQLVNSETDVCWEDTYDGTDITKHDSTQLKAKAGPEIPGAPLPVLRAPLPLDALTAEEAGVPAFVGEPAEARPISPLVIPEHPFLNNEGDSRIHNDAFNSAVYNRDGPLGVNVQVTTMNTLTGGDFVNVCAMLAFTEDGYVLGACIAAITSPSPGAATRLVMLDPVTLDVYAEVTVAPRPLIQNSAGGAYFSIDQAGRLIIGPANNHVEIWELAINGGQPAFVRLASYDVSGDLPDNALMQDTVVDWEGRLWFAAITGQVGYVDPGTGRVEILEVGEELQNSFAVDASGVYVVTFDAMHKFSVDANGSVQQDWRVPYDNSGPGLLQPGSGTTPTLFGTQNDLVGFADTAEPQINMVILDRTTGAEVCLTPLFRPGESGAENTFIGYDDEVVVVNNGGFPGTFGPQRAIYPGLEKYEVRSDRSGCDLVWANDAAIGNSAQLSTTTGLIYGWGPDPAVTDLDAYYLTANDWQTGEEVFRVYAGNDTPFNPVTGQPHLHPDGYAFVGALEGIIRLADTP